jgi:thiamine pyrophosphate-dependent acetolactate synthase large subunit-like protein
MTEHRNGGAAVVETLAAQGVDTIFGIPGTHNLEIYRHLPTTGIRAVTPRHEQGAGYAAEAYARVTGRPGVVVATSGPGLTNTMTAAATAYAESQRMLILSSGMPTGTDGKDLGQLRQPGRERRGQRRGARGATCRWRSHRGQLAGHVLRFGAFLRHACSPPVLLFAGVRHAGVRPAGRRRRRDRQAGTPVAVLLGDGALMFSIQELITLVEQRLPVPVIVVDNGGYREIRDQETARGIPPIGVELRTPDLAALAVAMGARGVRTTSTADLTDLVRDALGADGPTLIHFDIR